MQPALETLGYIFSRQTFSNIDNFQLQLYRNTRTGQQVICANRYREILQEFQRRVERDTGGGSKENSPFQRHLSVNIGGGLIEESLIEKTTNSSKILQRCRVRVKISVRSPSAPLSSPLLFKSTKQTRQENTNTPSHKQEQHWPNASKNLTA